MSASLTGLFFVHRESGPVGGVILGVASQETLIVRELSDPDPRTLYVPRVVALGWDFYSQERDALAAYAKACKDVLCLSDPTNKKPSTPSLTTCAARMGTRA